MFDFDEAWLQKLADLRAAGQEPYPNGFRVTHTAGQLRDACHEDDPARRIDDPSTLGVGEVRLAGRVLFRNRMGKAIFLRIQDRAGRIQIYLRKEEVGDDAFEAIKALDIGDFVWATGTLMRTKTGELSVQASAIAPAGKILTSFPDRWHGMTDTETRSRQRYVDLFMNDDARTTFRRRSAIVRYLRDFFWARDFIEVETPMMQVIPGGANARPFVTHHNTLDMDLYLRIAPELYLKRLVVGGMERVFELNRNFRNEGMSQKHNPEFTMLEFYQAWATYADLMDITEELLIGLVDTVIGGRSVVFGEMTLDFSPPFRRADMDELIAERTGILREDLQDPAAIERWWRQNHRVGADERLPTVRGKWWEWLFDAHVEKTLVNPTFVTGFPTEISPLSRRTDGQPDRVDRFELFIAGWEIANAFSELNDPVDQAQRFADQVAARDAGDEEGMHFDHDYIRALTYGMPPTAGQGIGVDRLVMLLTNRTNIRDVILFPTLRPEQR